MKKKILAAATMAAMSTLFMGWGMVQAADTTQLPEVIVEGEHYTVTGTTPVPGGYVNKDGGMGFLGKKDVMDVPFQQNNLTEKTVTTFGADPSAGLPSILVNVPSIRTVGNTLYHDFNIRGQKADAYQLRINGVPSMLSQTNVPTNFVENIEVTSGSGLGFNGVAAKESAGGVINMVTKKAHEKDITDYTTYFSGRSTWGNLIDVSRRVGDDKAWGIRLNAAHISGDTGIRSEEAKNKNISLNIDHRAERSNTNLFIGYRDTHTERAERYFDFSSNKLTHIPGAPDSKNNYAFDGQELGMKTHLMTLNHTQNITKDFDVFLNAGYAYNDGYDYLVDASSRLDVLNNKGDFTRKIVNEPFSIRNKYVQLGFARRFDIGAVKNELVGAIDKDWYEARWGTSAPSAERGTVIGNLYSGLLTYDKLTENVAKAVPGSKNQYYGWSLVDTLKYGKAEFTAGVHHHTSKTISKTSENKQDANSPLFGIVYRPNDNLAVFANHTESFDKGSVVGSGYLNKGATLDPVKNKSNEVGVKYTNGNFITSLSYFDMKQDAVMDKRDGSDLIRTNDGRTDYKGIEYSFSGKVAPKWVLSGGFMYLDSEYKHNNTKKLEGKKVSGVSDWSGVLTVEYEPNDDWNVWGRMVYTGPASIYRSDYKELEFSSSTVFDLGARFNTHFGSVPVTLNATVFNVFDKDYWLPRATYNYGILSNPRTFFVSAQMHF